MSKPTNAEQLRAGERAPDFEARDHEGRTWRLSDLRGRRVVLYFYPADDTPGCTAEACDFRDAREVFRSKDYVVLGVSPQGAESHRAFSTKYRLNFPLLIDEDFAIAARYGAVRDERGFYEDVPLDITRSTFVIDDHGDIVHALYGVQGRGHVAELSRLLKISEH